MKKLLLLTVFAISSFLSSINLAFSQGNTLTEDGLYNATSLRETVTDDILRTRYVNFSDIEISIRGNSNATSLNRLINAKLNFNDEGKATTIKVSEYLKDDFNNNYPGKWVYYHIEAKSSDKIK